MRRLNLVVSDEAGKILDTIKKEGGYKSLDNAMDNFLKSWSGARRALDDKTELFADESG